MTPSPLFSVVTVTWKNLQGLRLTAASVAAQREVGFEFEWIVIDGGSADGTREWLSSQPTERCRWISERDLGVFDAMNKGLERCRGRYVVFLNAGDEFASKDTLSRVRECLEACAQPPALVYGDSIDVEPNGREKYKKARQPSWIHYGMFASHQAMFFRRDHAPALRYDLRYPTSGDYAYIASFLMQQRRNDESLSYYIAQPLCRFLLGGMHFTRRQNGMREDFQIRRRVLRQSFLLAGGLYLLHQAHQFLKIRTPSLTELARYERNEPSVDSPTTRHPERSD